MDVVLWAAFVILAVWVGVGTLRHLWRGDHRRSEGEAPLLDSEQMELYAQFGDFFANATAPLHILAPDSTIIEMNQAELDLIGFQRDEVVGTLAWTDLIVPSQREQFEQHWDKVLKNQEVRGLEYTLVHKDGRHVPVLLDSSPCRDVEGELVGIRGGVVDISRWKEIEQALRDSEYRYRTLVENIPGALYRCETKHPWRVKHISKGIEGITGRGPGEFTSGQLALGDLIHPDDHARLTEGVRQALRDHTEFSFEYRLRGSNGEYRWVSENGRGVYDADGEPYCLDCIILDITDRRHALEQVAISEERYRTLVENIEIGIALMDSDCRILMANAAMEKLFETPVEEMVGVTCAEALGEYVMDWGRCPGKEAMEAGQTIESEVEGGRRDGSCLHLRIQAFPLSDSRGFIEVIEDVSERRVAALALAQSEEKYRNLFETAMVGLYRTRISDGKILACNQTAADILGYADPEEMERLFVSSEHYASPERRDELLELLAKDGRVDDFEVRFCFEGREARDVAISGAIYPEKGYLEGVVVDITERKRMEAERVRLDKQMQHTQKLESLGVLAGGIAHDFNNLLVAILGNADLALADMPPLARERSCIEEVKQAAKRASELTNQMLAYSGKGQFVISSVDLNELVTEMGRLLNVSISKKAGLHYELAENLPFVEADASQLRQVVMNLITNASDAIGSASGYISIRTSRVKADRETLTKTYLGEDLPEGDYVCLEVSDTGCGMDEEALSRLFEPFYSTKFSGRGLGLSAVLGIVRGHRGAIKVTSKPGEGTTFEILLPAGVSVGAVEGEPRHGEPIRWRESATVLVVDDESSVRDVAAMMLARAGLTVLTAGDGQEAVEMFRRDADQIDVVLLDMTMPRMGGAEACKQMQRIRPDVKIILASGYGEKAAMGRSDLAHVSAFIQKPFEMDKLLTVMREVLAS